MASVGFKKYVVNLVRSCESDFRYSFFHNILFNAKGRRAELYKEMATNPMLRGKIANSLFPKRLDQLSGIQFGYNEEISDAEALQYSFKLLALYGNRINRFLELRKEYESSYMKKQYVDASACLDMLEAELGVSLWSCGQRLMLKEQTVSLEGNKD